MESEEHMKEALILGEAVMECIAVGMSYEDVDEVVRTTFEAYYPKQRPTDG